ncbi:MAG: hypothetical protein ACRDTJ_06655 [Pseudonocardiaceae bacterium]
MRTPIRSVNDYFADYFVTHRALIVAALARHAPNLPVRVVDSGDDGAMMEVVTAAAELARPGDVGLLASAVALTQPGPVPFRGTGA